MDQPDARPPHMSSAHESHRPLPHHMRPAHAQAAPGVAPPGSVVAIVRTTRCKSHANRTAATRSGFVSDAYWE